MWKISLYQEIDALEVPILQCLNHSFLIVDTEECVSIGCFVAFTRFKKYWVHKIDLTCLLFILVNSLFYRYIFGIVELNRRRQSKLVLHSL